MHTEEIAQQIKDAGYMSMDDMIAKVQGTVTVQETIKKPRRKNRKWRQPLLLPDMQYMPLKEIMKVNGLHDSRLTHHHINRMIALRQLARHSQGVYVIPSPEAVVAPTQHLTPQSINQREVQPFQSTVVVNTPQMPQYIDVRYPLVAAGFRITITAEPIHMH